MLQCTQAPAVIVSSWHGPPHLLPPLASHMRLCVLPQISGMADCTCCLPLTLKMGLHVPSQIIGVACLHLAAKMEETPQPIRELVKESTRLRDRGFGEESVRRRMEPVSVSCWD